MRATDRRDARLGQADVADLPGLLQFPHRADGLLDRDGRVDAMLVVEVYRVDAKASQRCIARAADVFGRAVDAEPRSVIRADVSKLRGEHHFIATPADSTADQAFIGERS